MATLTRRSFLERVGSTAAAVTALAIRPSRAAGGMFVSLNGALTSGKNVGWPEFAQLAARTGYGGVDWSLGPAKTAGVDATRALLDGLKLKPTIVNLPVQAGRGDDAAFQTGLQQLEEDAQFSAAIGCLRMMQTLPPTSPTPKAEYRPRYRDRIAAIAEVLQRSKIRLGLEFLGVEQFRARANANEFIWQMGEAVELATDCGPNVGVVLDAWHWHHSGSTIQDILNAGNARVVHVHVSDARQQPPAEVRDNQRLMPGEGVIDLVGFFKALKTIGYVDGVSPEPLGRIPPEMGAEEAAKLGLETTTVVMRRADVG